MNYFAEVRAFSYYKMQSNITASEIALWHGLMDLANMLDKSEFQADVSTLLSHSKLARRTLFLARQRLCERGLISYSTDGTYKIFKISERLNGKGMPSKVVTTEDASSLRPFSTDDALPLHSPCTDDALPLHSPCTDDALPLHSPCADENSLKEVRSLRTRSLRSKPDYTIPDNTRRDGLDLKMAASRKSPLTQPQPQRNLELLNRPVQEQDKSDFRLSATVEALSKIPEIVRNCLVDWTHCTISDLEAVGEICNVKDHELVIKAISVCESMKTRTVGYMRSVLKNWDTEGGVRMPGELRIPGPGRRKIENPWDYTGDARYTKFDEIFAPSREATN